MNTLITWHTGDILMPILREGDIYSPTFYKIIEKENQEHPLTLEDIDKYIEYYTINQVQRNTLKEYLCCIRVYLP